MDFDGSSMQAESIHQPTLPPDFKPSSPLPEDQLTEILNHLRPEGHEVAIIQMPQPGEDLIPVLREKLTALGYDSSHLLKRVIDTKRLQQALETGTDRDEKSDIDSQSAILGNTEELAMLANGLNPSTDRDLVTYVAELNTERNTKWFISDNQSNAILIYAPDALQYIQPPTKTEAKPYNGFAMFKDRRLTHRSLLAVVTPTPTSTTLQQKSGS